MLKQMRKMKEADGGFTLIELLLVIVILGILAAVVVFSVSGISDRGTASACKASKSSIQTASEAMYAQTKAYPLNLEALKSGGFVVDFNGTVLPAASATQVLTNTGGWHLDMTWSANAAPVFAVTSTC